LDWFKGHEVMDATRNLLVRCGRGIVTMLVLLMMTGGVLAEGCHGSLVATALRPLPKPLVIMLDLRDASDQNKALAALFLDAMRSAGTKTDGQASARLHLIYSVLGGADGRGSMGGVEHSIDGLSGLSDVGSRALPQMPSRRFGQPAPAPSPAVLFLRAELSQVGSERVDWVASVQCQMGSATPDELATQMGQLIGQVAGRSAPRISF
jgi:hypothetical protein